MAVKHELQSQGQRWGEHEKLHPVFTIRTLT